MEYEKVASTQSTIVRNGGFKAVLSYGRVCAMVDRENVYIVEGLHDYSSTTMKHVNRFAREHGIEELEGVNARRNPQSPNVYTITEKQAEKMLYKDKGKC